MRRRVLTVVALLVVALAAVFVHDMVDLGTTAAAPPGTPLRERLARVADRSTLVLTHRGRTTGRAYDVTIWFVVDGETVFLTTMDRGRQWVRNVARAPEVELRIGAERFSGRAAPVTTTPEKLREYELLVRKYWILGVLHAIGRLAVRDPVTTLDASRGGFFRVDGLS